MDSLPLRDAFAESDLSYRLDVVNWHRISAEFRKIIEEQESEIVQKV